MTETSFDHDIVIAGGGMVGASLALLLSQHSKGQLKILIVESFSPPESSSSAGPVFRPSFDARSSAISYGSRKILEPLGIWSVLEQHCASIHRIHVCEQGRFGSTLMTCEEAGWPALGYVVENAWLGNVLLSEIKQHQNIQFISPASVAAVHNHPSKIIVDIQGLGENYTQIKAPLMVVADGANSKLRQQLGINAKTDNYHQTALITNVSFTRPHNGVAYERFTEKGPMALLPLNDSEQSLPRAALVWTMTEERAKLLSLCEEKHFLQQLQLCFGNRQGEFVRVGERVTYPLALVQAQEQIRSGIVIMGNAAHSLHPVAGQGFNLALRDCTRLAMIVADNLDKGVSLGDHASLQRYFDSQQFDQYKTVGFSDQLPALFNHRIWGVGIARRFGLGMLDILPSAKRQFINHAAGMHDGSGIIC